jgi:threonine 3-dehydrogenase
MTVVQTTRSLVLARAEADALDLISRDVPAPDTSQALVRIRRAGICGTDLHITGWNEWAARSYSPPVALGHEFCGEIVELSENRRGLTVGDRVTAETHWPCGDCRQCRTGNGHICDNLRTFSRLGQGGFSDYVVVPIDLLRKVPDGVPDEIGCMMEPLGIALRAVSEPGVAGCDLLVVGCGPIGLLAIAAARALGAATIVASDLSEDRRRLATAMGATHAIDPRQTPVADFVRTTCDGGAALSVDTSGAEAGIADALAATVSGGTCVTSGLPPDSVPIDLTRHIVLREVTLKGVYGRRIDRTWLAMERLLRQPGFDLSPLITHRFSLDDYRAAFGTAREGRSGKVLFEISDAT